MARTKTVMIVDDEAEAVEVLTSVFEMWDFDVIAANDGMHACELLQNNRPDIILSDYMMPRLDGLQLCELIKKDPDTADIPFVLMTATNQALDNSVADTVLRKPVRFEVLLGSLEHLLKSAPSASKFVM